MATIEDLQADLQSYVSSVANIESENSELKRRVAYLENDREREAMLWMEKLEKGKHSWREQALQHGRNQKQRTFLECEKLIQALQSDMRAQHYANQTKDNALLLSSLLRAENSNEIADHQRRVFEAMAFTGATKITVTLQDYDIEDNHVSLCNRTDLEVSLIGCSLKFKPSGARYKFPDDTLIMPNSTLSVWYGNMSHSLVRNSSGGGSLHWNSDYAVTTDFSSTVSLVDKNGVIFAFVPANERRYPCAAMTNESIVSASNGHTSLLCPQDNFLRFNHFLQLKNDCNGESTEGFKSSHLPATIKRERSSETSTTTTSSSSSSSSSSVKPHSVRKRSRKSNTASPFSSNVIDEEMNGSTIQTPVAKDSKTIDNAQSMRIVNGIESSDLPSDTHTHISLSTSTWNARALTLSLRPYLRSRNQGCLSIVRAVRRGGSSSSVAISIYNSSDIPIDLAGWRLFAMGNPSQEFFLPSECYLNGRSKVTLVSSLDAETLLWTQIASSSAAISASAPTANAAVAVPAASYLKDIKCSDAVGRRESFSLFDDVDNRFKSSSKSSSGSGSSVIESEGDRDSSISSSAIHTDARKERGQGVASSDGSHICEVAGFRSLAVGDVLSLHLLDSHGRNICMLSSEKHVYGHRLDETEKNSSRGQLTVFEDNGQAQISVKTSHFHQSLSIISDFVRCPSAIGCSIQ